MTSDNNVASVATDLLVYHEKNVPLEVGYCIHNGKTIVPGYPTQLPGSGSTGPMTSGPGYPDPGGKPRQFYPKIRERYASLRTKWKRMGPVKSIATSRCNFVITASQQ